jgi:hypothetical protein
VKGGFWFERPKKYKRQRGVSLEKGRSRWVVSERRKLDEVREWSELLALWLELRGKKRKGKQ